MEELVETAAEALGSVELARKLVECFCTVTPPKSDPPLMEWMTINSRGRGGGVSVKPGNVLLNMRQLTAALADGVLSAVGVVDRPWTALIAAVVIWDRIVSCLRVEVGEVEASILWVLWLKSDEQHTFAKSGLLSTVNFQRTRYGYRPINEQELADALALLTRMRCIKESGDAARWCLRESVSVRYK